ncbi:MAG: CotH kinase family protein, partial [Candidatus Omnitrophica bacterium]|nr:CotH kinase family protein [Candidatus Omnitrophota bacterium]
YSNGALSGINWERACSAELIFSDGTEGFAINSGIRIQGQTSTDPNWKSPKLSMRLLFKNEYGPSHLEFPLYPDSSVHSFDTLVLDARLNQTWIHPWDLGQRIRAQYLRDQFMSDAQIAMGHLSSHGRYVHLFLNGLYWGLYDIHERPDEHFHSDYLGGVDEDYDVIRHNPFDVVSGSNNGYTEMLTIARGDLSSPAQYNELKQFLEIVPFIDYMILNFWAGNDDWAHKNWYAGRNRIDGSGFRYFSWDAEHTLKNVLENVVLKNDFGGPTELLQRLKQNDEFLILFADRVQKQLFNEGVLTPKGAWSLYEKRADEIDPAIILESARWGDHRRDHHPVGGPYDLYTRDIHWVNELNRLRDTYFPFRTGIVLNQLRAAGLFPDLDAPMFEVNGSPQHGGSVWEGERLVILNPNQSGTIYFTIEGSDPRVEGGGILDGALPFSAPIVLTSDTVVRARVFGGSKWSALAEAEFKLNPGPRPTQIELDVSNWWMYD